MTILVWLIIGGVAGWLASKVVNQGKGSGPLTNIIVGIIGAMLGGWLVSLMGGDANVLTGFNFAKPTSTQNTPGDGWGVLYEIRCYLNLKVLPLSIRFSPQEYHKDRHSLVTTLSIPELKSGLQ